MRSSSPRWRCKSKAQRSPDPLTTSATILRNSVMRSASCTNSFIPHGHWEVSGIGLTLFHPDFCNSLSARFPPFISTLLPATGLLLSNLKLVTGFYSHTAVFPKLCPVEHQFSRMFIYRMSNSIVRSRKDWEILALKNRVVHWRLNVSDMPVSVAKFLGQ